MPSDSADENDSSVGQKRQGALQVGPRKKAYVPTVYPCHCFLSLYALMFENSCGSNPLIHHGRYFGRTVHAMSNVSALLNNAIVRLVEQEENPDLVLSRE